MFIFYSVLILGSFFDDPVVALYFLFFWSFCASGAMEISQIFILTFLTITFIDFYLKEHGVRLCSGDLYFSWYFYLSFYLIYFFFVIFIMNEFYFISTVLTTRIRLWCHIFICFFLIVFFLSFKIDVYVWIFFKLGWIFIF